MKEQLTLNEYQTLANVTRNKELDTTGSLTNYALGLTGEAGEVADIIKKFAFHDHPLDVKDVIKELGDVMWYIATLASTLGVDLEHIACKNIDKLRERYPEGFDPEKSINRIENQSVNTYANSAWIAHPIPNIEPTISYLGKEILESIERNTVRMANKRK